MEELGVGSILQVDATIITGILMLLTLSQTRVDISMGKGVATVVVPFTLSAILAIFHSICGCYLKKNIFSKARWF